MKKISIQHLQIMDKGYLYLVMEREFIKTGESICKVGRTKDIFTRMKAYPNGSKLLFTVYTMSMTTLESRAIELLKDVAKRRIDIGLESFEGNVSEMVEALATISVEELKRNKMNLEYTETEKTEMRRSIYIRTKDYNISKEKDEITRVERVQIPYQCNRCGYTSILICDMKRHFTRKSGCPSVISEDEANFKQVTEARRLKVAESMMNKMKL